MDGYFRRQIQLNEVGEAGQQKLLSSHVIVVGAGGLGCLVLSQLASCGIGRITMVDFDNVETHNLHRQPLYGPTDVGRPKAEAAAQFLQERYPHCHFEPINSMFDALLASELVPDADLLLDCTDNLPVRYLLDDAALIFSKAWVHASVSKFNLQWALFRPNEGYAYRIVFPEPPNPLFMGQCHTEGVLGSVSALAGVLQANLALNTLLGLGEYAGKIYHMDTRNGETYSLKYIPQITDAPQTAVQMLNYDYAAFCRNFKS